MRSPLTSIMGNASNLISRGKYFDDDTKTRIYKDIHDDSKWLINMVENILSITCLEENKMDLPFSLELLDEIVNEAVRHIKKDTPNRKITVEFSDDILFVKVNARLIELGDAPVVEIENYPVITDVKEMLEYDYKDAAEALPEMSKALALFDDDYVTKEMIQKFIIDEQEHYNWVKTHLCIIEQIGIENYLIEQLGE